MEGHENQSIERPNTLCNLELNPVGDPGNDPDNPIPHNPTPHNPIPDNPIPRRVPNNLPNDNKQVLYITSGIVMIIAILCYGISSYAAMKLELEMVKEDLTNIKQILKHKLLNQYLEDKFSLEDCSIQNNGNCSYKVKYTMPYVNIPHDIPVTIHYTYGIAIRGNIIASIPIPPWSLPWSLPSCIYIHDTSNPSNSRIQYSDIHEFIGVAITLDGKDLLSIIHHEDVYHILAKKINAAENEDEQIVIHKVPSVTNYPHLCALAIHPIHGHIFVADMTNKRIHVFNSDFSYNYTFGGGKGNTKEKFLFPESIAIDKKGYVYVTDYGRDCVFKFNSKGIFIKKFGSDQLNSPLGIAIDSYGGVYVLNKIDRRIYIFDSDGNFIHYIEYIRDGDKVMCIPATWAIAIDDNDNLIIPDNERRKFIVI
jgi:hypothetical protein